MLLCATSSTSNFYNTNFNVLITTSSATSDFIGKGFNMSRLTHLLLLFDASAQLHSLWHLLIGINSHGELPAIKSVTLFQ
jgi:hypothetical protein